MAVNLSNIWEERHKEKRRDTAALRKTLVALKENIEQQNQQIKALYESFALGEISKSEYLTIKSAAVKQRDAAADRLAELEASLENMGTDGSLQNSFVSAFGKYTEVEEITSEIVSEVLSEVRIYPDKRLEIVWNFRDEMERLVLELQENHQDG